MSSALVFLYFIILQFLLISPYYFFYKKYYIKKGRKNNRSAILQTILTPIFLTFFAYQILFNVYSPWLRSKKFNSIEWKEDNDSRYRMVNDMIKSKSFIGKTKNELTEMLGDDFEIQSCNDCIGFSTHDPDGGSFLDHDVLVFYFDEQQKVNLLNIEAW